MSISARSACCQTGVIIIRTKKIYQFSMRGLLIFRISSITVALIAFQTVSAQQVAFPGAEGFGRFATGGRNGTVYHVTNLNDAGEGSFRDAVSQPNRIIVFDVAGVIKIKDKITAAKKITVAGQTAPGDGVVVYGNGISFSDSSIIRHMRFRGSINMPRGGCVVVADDLKDIIFDHVSIEWGRWDDLHIKNSTNVTMQYCLIGEPIDPQRFGALFEGPTNVTIHHCLWIDNQSRNPKAKAGIEYINNVVYNYGVNGLVGGHSGADHFQDVISNYFIAGPNSGKAFIGMFSATDHVYQSGNCVDINKDGVLNGRAVIDTDFVHAAATLVAKKQNNPPVAVKVESAANAYRKVLAEAGASLKRDAVDLRIIGYLKSLGKDGKIFKTEVDAGGQPEIASAKIQKDTDADGIPDAWESRHGMNATSADDAFRVNSNGYTRLEEYINELAIKK
jgi:pectate lyase